MKAHTDLVLYKRHLSGCTIAKGRAKPAKKKLMFDCACPFWLMGRMASGDAVPRQSTGTADRREAERKCAELCSMNAESNAKPGVHGPTIDECIKRYLADKEEEVEDGTLAYITKTLSRLKEYCAGKAITYAREITIDVVSDFRADTMKDLKPGSRRVAMATMKCFFRDAFRKKWLTVHVAEMMPRTKSEFEQKQPYEPDEIKRLMAGAKESRRGSHPYNKYAEMFCLLLELMLETGMRLSDAILYDPGTVRKGKYFRCYTFEPDKQNKTAQKKRLTVYLTEELTTAIDNCQWASEKLPFYCGPWSRIEAHGTMKMIGFRQNIKDCHPHRLRHTFAVRKLLAGVPIEEVSRLLGHSSVKITEQYYAAWTTSRQDLLESRLFQSLQVSPDNTLRY